MSCPTLPNYRIRQAFVFVCVIGRRWSNTEGVTMATTWSK
jgi:hypothetical protein